MSSHYVLALRSNSIVICRKDLGLLVASIMVPWSHFAKNTGGAIITCFFLSLSISLFVVCSSDCHLIDSLICFFIQFIKQLFCKLAVWLSLVTVMLRVWSVYSRMLHVAALQLSVWCVSWVSTSCVPLCTVQLTVNLCEATLRWSLQWPYTDPEMRLSNYTSTVYQYCSRNSCTEQDEIQTMLWQRKQTASGFWLV